jgi:hypothetical protein
VSGNKLLQAAASAGAALRVARRSGHEDLTLLSTIQTQILINRHCASPLVDLSLMSAYSLMSSACVMYRKFLELLFTE